MQTSPATTPEQVPKTEGLPRVIHSIAAQVSPPAAAAKWVAQKRAGRQSAGIQALPALKPNQPTQSMAAPTAV